MEWLRAAIVGFAVVGAGAFTISERIVKRRQAQVAAELESLKSIRRPPDPFSLSERQDKPE